MGIVAGLYFLKRDWFCTLMAQINIGPPFAGFGDACHEHAVKVVEEAKSEIGRPLSPEQEAEQASMYAGYY